MKQLVVWLFLLFSVVPSFAQSKTTFRPNPRLASKTLAHSFIRITLTLKGVTLQETMAALPDKVQSILNSGTELITQQVDIDQKDATVQEFMAYLCTLFPVHCTLDGNLITVYRNYRADYSTLLVQDTAGQPLADAYIEVKETGVVLTTSRDGRRTVLVDSQATLKISYTGKIARTLSIRPQSHTNVALKDEKPMDPVYAAAANGHHTDDRKNFTGSYQVVNVERSRLFPTDNYLGKVASENPLLKVKESRFNGMYAEALRGITSMNGNKTALLIVDGFPITYSTAFLNSFDIHSTTIIKDAATGGDWGSRSANGVIVVETKPAPTNAQFHLNYTTQSYLELKPLFSYEPNFTSSDYIDIELERAIKYPDSTAAVPSLVKDLYGQYRASMITEATLHQQLDSLRQLNLQDALQKHFYQAGVGQEHSLSTGFGFKQLGFYFFGSFMEEKKPARGNRSYRTTGRARLTYANKRFSLEIGGFLANLKTRNNFISVPVNRPYYSLLTPSGQAAAVNYKYSNSYLASLDASKYMDMHYYPLTEAATADNTLSEQLQLLSISTSYKICSSLVAKLQGQITRNSYDNKENHSLPSFFTRDLINRYQQPGYSPIPKGSILDQEHITNHSSDARIQLNFKKEEKNYTFAAYAGAEIGLRRLQLGMFRTYGYDLSYPQQLINYDSTYTLLNGRPSKIPHIHQKRDSVTNSGGFYITTNFQYRSKYLFSAALRKDFSNHFTPAINDHGLPLWVLGAAWRVNKALNFRVTLGETGNIDYSAMPFTTLDPVYTPNGEQIFTLSSVAPSTLGPEKTLTLNIASDIVIRKLASITLEWYVKRSSALVQSVNTNPTLGYPAMKANTGAINGWGMEGTLESKEFTSGKNKAMTLTLQLAYNKHKITSYQGANKEAWLYADPTSRSYKKDYPVDAIFALPYQGLHRSDGSPLGKYKDSVSAQYNEMLQDTSNAAVLYMGRSNPPLVASFVPTFRLWAFTFEWMVSLQLGHKAWKKPLNYHDVFYRQGALTSDYRNRWQKPGDELHTTVPSSLLPPDESRDKFFGYSSANVINASHARLQYVRIGFCPARKFAIGSFSNKLSLHLTVSNLPILWRANKDGIDPALSQQSLPPGVRFTFSANIRIN